MDESGRKRGGRQGDKPKEARPLPSLEFDTVRPPGSADADAYSAETVVRALPRELLNELNAAMKPAKVPVIEAPPSAEAPANEPAAKTPATMDEAAPKEPAMLSPAPAAPPEAPPTIEAAPPSAPSASAAAASPASEAAPPSTPSASAPESTRSIEAAAPVSTPTVEIEREPTREELGVMSSKRLTVALLVALAALIAVVVFLAR